MSDPSAQPSPPPGTSAFAQLAPGLQRRLYAMRWPSLRPLQVDAIHTYLPTPTDMLLMAETAGGKTEAAFLPILSSIAHEPGGSVRVVYVGPLRALINDQFSRLEALCTHMDMPVHRWHGDVGDAAKRRLIAEPGGVLLITPESLESLLINRTRHLGTLFGGLRAVVIDELHAFLGGERGLHLASLLARIARYRAAGEPPTRYVGLSATIGDTLVAQRYLRPDAPEAVRVLSDDGEQVELRLRVHGYDALALVASRPRPTEPDPQPPDDDTPDPEEVVTRAIAEDLVEHCRGHSNLVFANAKGDIEIMADVANERAAREGLPDRFLVHHGSLSREIREDTEAQMKSGRPRTTVCSSTLEMGIDIGAVRMVGQIDPPWSAASLKQRMGRSGRRAGEVRRLRCYVDCTISPKPSSVLDALPLDLLQCIAVIDLVLSKWVEPPPAHGLDLSTLTHQAISSIAELGACAAQDLHHRLCVHGPFGSVDARLFARLLRALGEADILEQGPDGLLILGLLGERLRKDREFYAAFASRSEYAVRAAGRVLGTLPLASLPQPGDHIVFAARRWQVATVDAGRRELLVQPARRRKRPRFVGAPGQVHDRVPERMRQLLTETTEPVYLDATATEALRAARRHAAQHGLHQRAIIDQGEGGCVWMTWAGTAQTTAAVALLATLGIKAEDQRVAISCPCPADTLRAALRRARASPPSPHDLALMVEPAARRKYDEHLPDDLLREVIAAELVWPASLLDGV